MSTIETDALRSKVTELLGLLGGHQPTATPKSWYTVEEAAAELSRSAYTVREWCRLGQCRASRTTGWRAGPHCRWRISREEIERIRVDGLLPIDTGRNRPSR